MTKAPTTYLTQTIDVLTDWLTTISTAIDAVEPLRTQGSERSVAASAHRRLVSLALGAGQLLGTLNALATPATSATAAAATATFATVTRDDLLTATLGVNAFLEQNRLLIEDLVSYATSLAMAQAASASKSGSKATSGTGLAGLYTAASSALNEVVNAASDAGDVTLAINEALNYAYHNPSNGASASAPAQTPPATVTTPTVKAYTRTAALTPPAAEAHASQTPQAHTSHDAQAQTPPAAPASAATQSAATLTVTAADILAAIETLAAAKNLSAADIAELSALAQALAAAQAPAPTAATGTGTGTSATNGHTHKATAKHATHSDNAALFAELLAIVTPLLPNPPNPPPPEATINHDLKQSKTKLEQLRRADFRLKAWEVGEYTRDWFAVVRHLDGKPPAALGGHGEMGSGSRRRHIASIIEINAGLAAVADELGALADLTAGIDIPEF